jgi:hypothetical protein
MRSIPITSTLSSGLFRSGGAGISTRCFQLRLGRAENLGVCLFLAFITGLLRDGRIRPSLCV